MKTKLSSKKIYKIQKKKEKIFVIECFNDNNEKKKMNLGKKKFVSGRSIFIF